MTRRPRLTTRGQCFLGVGLATVAVGVLLGFPDITRIGVLLTVLPFLAVVLAARPEPPLEARRAVSPALVAPGAAAQVRLLVRNAGRRRSPLRLAEEDPGDHGTRVPRFLVPPMAPGEYHEVRYEVRTTARGRHELGPLHLEQRDTFGLTTTRRALRGVHELLVLPHIADLGSRARHRGEMGADGQVPHMLARHGEDDVTIRDYRDGDDLRRVHWPTTAHRGELMVRQEDRPERRRAVLLLDTREAAFAHAPEAFEWAVSAVASAAVHLTRHGYAVHVTGLGAVPPDDSLRALLPALAVVEPSAAEITGSLQEAQALAADGAVVVAAVADHLPAELLRLSGVRSPGSPATALVLDTASFATGADGRALPPPAAGDVDGLTATLLDAGWRCRVVAEHEDVRTAWRHVSQRAPGSPVPAAGSTR